MSAIKIYKFFKCKFTCNFICNVLKKYYNLPKAIFNNNQMINGKKGIIQMEKTKQRRTFKQFAKDKNIEISVQRYLIDALALWHLVYLPHY